MEARARKRRYARKKEDIFAQAAVWMTVAALLLGAGALCWKGAQLLWNGVRNVLDHLAPAGSAVSLVESTAGDREAPMISGVHDFIVYQGDTIAYLSGVAATDETDAAPAITVDSSAVDLSRPGEYPVIYTAADTSGNTSQAKATVTVLEKQAGFADLDTIYAAADAKLSEIIRENATMEQQVRDIYSWARTHLSYGGHSDRTDWYQAAYLMLTEGKGDCYGYWAVTKLLFERLEIPNTDVRKVKNSEDDTDHFWSLVSLDGGESWYHFDATPRYGEGDDFCLVTDAFLDAYSDSHKGSHNRDKSLYPATP